MERASGRRETSHAKFLGELELDKSSAGIKVARAESYYAFAMWRRHRRELYGYQQLTELQGFCVSPLFASVWMKMQTREPVHPRDRNLFRVRELLTHFVPGPCLWNIGTQVPADKWEKVVTRAVNGKELTALLCGVVHEAEVLNDITPRVQPGPPLVFHSSFADCRFEDFEDTDEWEYMLQYAAKPFIYRMRGTLELDPTVKRLADEMINPHPTA